MSSNSFWIVGPSRSGKTTRLIQQCCDWAKNPVSTASGRIVLPFLVFAANGDNRIELVEQLAVATHGQQPFDSATPLGFFQDEVTLFWPLLMELLQLKAQFPLRLRPETEQELATALWRPQLDSGELALPGVRDYFVVRRSLDLLQLAASAGIPPEDIPILLTEGLGDQMGGSADLWSVVGAALLQWRQWCLERGLLTYSLITELYWRYLLPHPTYQEHLRRRYQAVLADDVDEYPAIAQALFSVFLDQGRPVALTYNPMGAIRLGLGADPHHLATLAERCQTEVLEPPAHTLGTDLGPGVEQWLSEPLFLPDLPDTLAVIQAISRIQLLQTTAETLAQDIHSGQVKPQEVAIIGPGLDAIARYTLRAILAEQGIAVQSLSDQQPLVSSPLIRALLTLLGLVYPGLGHLLSREAIAEMLVVLSQSPSPTTGISGIALARIDPVRAGLITDYCFVADVEHPHLLPATTFPRWDRLGHQATYVYGEIVQWIEIQHQQQQQRLIPNPVAFLDRAIQRFFYGGSHLPYDQLAALRELIETAQHYWDVDTRLRQTEAARPDLSPRADAPASTVEQFIQLLNGGTITADPYPARPLGPVRPAVTLATIFQYRSQRRSHRWQFWLDVGSPLWLTGGGALFGAPLFLHDWSGRLWTVADTQQADQQRLKRQLIDLLYRADERVYLCHSDLATNGQEQNGPLALLANAAPAVSLAVDD